MTHDCGVHLFMHVMSCSTWTTFVRLSTATDRLLVPTICMPHKDGGIPLSAFAKVE